VAFVLAPFFLLAAAFLFVVVFVFAAAWFAHLALDELAALRALEPTPEPNPKPIAESPAP
jgi:hypothetical protein